jgi:hypothetical protein
VCVCACVCVCVYVCMYVDTCSRYGDRVHVDADLQLLQQIRCVVKPGGKLFLAVAVGRYDLLIWNLRRQYGCVWCAARPRRT